MKNFEEMTREELLQQLDILVAYNIKLMNILIECQMAFRSLKSIIDRHEAAISTVSKQAEKDG